MVRDGALTLSDLRQPMIGVVCEPCGRHGRYKHHDEKTASARL
jgi:hypothetical protein